MKDTAALEKDGASVVGAREGGLATLGTGFAAGALCAHWDELDVWVLNFELWAATFLTVVCLKRVERPPVTVDALRSLTCVSADFVFYWYSFAVGSPLKASILGTSLYGDKCAEPGQVLFRNLLNRTYTTNLTTMERKVL